ncbi:UNVERIFIED_CONTAM: hypothetical protein DES50_10516 [Williamsia faeni]
MRVVDPWTGADSSDWTTAAQRESLMHADATFLAVDLPGHSPVGAVTAFEGLSDLGDRLAELPLSLGWKSFGVCGYSFGGLVGLHVEASSPRVDWSAVGGVGARHFTKAAASAGMADRFDTETEAFLHRRQRDRQAIASLLTLEPTQSADLVLGDDLRLLATPDDIVDVRSLASQLQGRPIVTALEGDHISALQRWYSRPL